MRCLSRERGFPARPDRRPASGLSLRECDMNAKNGMRPVHPGEILRDELDELGLSANALSKALGVPVNRVTMILNGQRGVSADTALRLARYFGTTPQLWLNLQKAWELRRAEIESGGEIAERVTPRLSTACAPTSRGRRCSLATTRACWRPRHEAPASYSAGTGAPPPNSPPIRNATRTVTSRPSRRRVTSVSPARGLKLIMSSLRSSSVCSGRPSIAST